MPDYVSLDLLAAMVEASPRGAYACREVGLTPTQVAYAAINDLAGKPQHVRDSMLKTFTGELGMYGIGTERDCVAFLAETAERYTGERQRLEDKPFAERMDRDAQARHFSTKSADTPTRWSDKAIKHVGERAAGALLTQGLTRRLAQRDGEPVKGVAPKYAEAVDDREYTRALIRQQLGEEPQGRTRYRGMTYETATVGDHVRAAYGHHEVEEDRANADRDGLEDLRGYSNTVVASE